MKGMHFIYEGVNSLFRFINHKFLNHDVLTGIPYYVPQWLGGLQMDPGPNPEKMITLIQRKQAFNILKKIKKQPVLHPNRFVQCKLDFLVNDIVKRSTPPGFNQRVIESYIFNDKGEVIGTTVHHSEIKPVKTILNEVGECLNLEQENLLLYNNLIEQVWRNVGIESTFIQSGKTVLCEADKLFWRKFNKNKRLWLNSYESSQNLPPIPWELIWHQSRNVYQPAVFHERYPTSCVRWQADPLFGEDIPLIMGVC
jgi:hypothetical protein